MVWYRLLPGVLDMTSNMTIHTWFVEYDYGYTEYLHGTELDLRRWFGAGHGGILSAVRIL